MAAEVTPSDSLTNDEMPPVKKLKTCDDDVKDGQADDQLSNDIGRKRKVALLLGFCGVGYLGMQRNPGTKTIEEDLIAALFKAGTITEDAKKREQKMAFQRASRTDKGVSAAAQVVSLKMLMVDDAIRKINSYLPEAIRVYGHFRVTKGFNSKTACDARSYQYLLPTYAFADKNKQPGRDFFLLQYRADEAILQRVQEVLSMYVGTRNFHNFTSKKAFEDDSAKRYIMEFNCGKPFVRNHMEFVVLTVKGQSFMLHQIRKMIGLMIGIVRGDATIEAMEKSWEKDRIDIPRAPGLGLILDQLYYNAYNRKIERLGIHSAIDNSVFESEIEEFKNKYIYDYIIEKEVKEYCFLKWIESLTFHSFDERSSSGPGQSNEKNSEGNNDSTNEAE